MDPTASPAPVDPAPQEPERFYFRVLDDILFVFDADRETAHVLNAAAARFFLALPESFADPAALAQAAGLPADAGLDDCLAAWNAFGWIERDATGRVRLCGRAPRDADPAPMSLPETAAAATPVEQLQVRLGGRSIEVRLFAEGMPATVEDADDGTFAHAANVAGGRRLFGFFGGLLDPEPQRHAPVAILDLIVGPEAFTLRCGGRVLRTERAVVAVGKARAWLLDLAYDDPPPRIFIHAAVLANEAGSVVMAGVSGAGKSTLSAYLVSRGWRFGADDSPALGFVDGVAVVLPCPGAINLKPGSLAPLAPYYPQLAALPLIGTGEKRGRYLPVPADRHLPPRGPANVIRGFVFPRFEVGSPTRVEAISPSRALLQLMEAEFDLAENAGAAELDAFFDTLERLPHHAIIYSDLAEMERTLARLVAGESA